MLLCPFHFEVVNLFFDVVLMFGVRVAQLAFLRALPFIQLRQFLAILVIECVQFLALLFRVSLKIFAGDCIFSKYSSLVMFLIV